MKYIGSLLIALALLVSPLWLAPANTAQASGAFPTFSIVSVDTDDSVTIRTHNFPANDSFVVRMGAMGTRGVGGVKVTTTNSGSGGTFNATYSIPASLKGSYQIAIRLESPTSGYFAYNWFYNDTSGKGAPYPKPPKGYWSYPTFSITSVIADDEVTVKTKNLPPNDSFVVRMGAMGTRGVGGVKVATVDTDGGGTKSFTFDVPKSLKGSYQIAIRMESPSSGYFAYNWFYNNTTGQGGQPSPPQNGYYGYPTFWISSVIRNDEVTIQAKNLPPNDSFVVRMGAMGTRGIGGVKVDTVDSKAGGSKSFTFDIPSSLKNSYQIAIRLESPSSGYFAYNWFYNNTANVDP